MSNSNQKRMPWDDEERWQRTLSEVRTVRQQYQRSLEEEPLPDYVAELMNKLQQAHDVLIVDRPILASWLLQAAHYIECSERGANKQDE